MENASVGTTYRQRMLCFTTSGTASFRKLPPKSGAALMTLAPAAASAFGDLDNDGFIDVVVNNLDGKPPF